MLLRTGLFWKFHELPVWFWNTKRQTVGQGLAERLLGNGGRTKVLENRILQSSATGLTRISRWATELCGLIWTKAGCDLSTWMAPFRSTHKEDISNRSSHSHFTLIFYFRGARLWTVKCRRLFSTFHIFFSQPGILSPVSQYCILPLSFFSLKPSSNPISFIKPFWSTGIKECLSTSNSYRTYCSYLCLHNCINSQSTAYFCWFQKCLVKST